MLRNLADPQHLLYLRGLSPLLWHQIHPQQQLSETSVVAKGWKCRAGQDVATETPAAGALLQYAEEIDGAQHSPDG